MNSSETVAPQWWYQHLRSPSEPVCGRQLAESGCNKWAPLAHSLHLPSWPHASASTIPYKEPRVGGPRSSSSFSFTCICITHYFISLTDKGSFSLCDLTSNSTTTSLTKLVQASGIQRAQEVKPWQRIGPCSKAVAPHPTKQKLQPLALIYHHYLRDSMQQHS
jgi:hypothetical protein